MLEHLRPRQFDLKKPEEVRRLLIECEGYLQVCKRNHHGTDFEGRQFAIEALRALADQQLHPDGQLRFPQATDTAHE
jgi:hypothetical protein